MGIAQNENQLNRYLLGAVTDTEQAEIEARFLRDAEFLENVQALEDELIDDYLQDNLSQRENEQFDNFLATRPRRQQKFEFARELLRMLKDSAAPATTFTATSPNLSWWESLTASLNKPRLALQAALVILTLIMAGVSLWFIVERQRTRTELAQVNSEQQAQQRQVADLQQELAAERVRREEMDNQLQGKQDQSLRGGQTGSAKQRNREGALIPPEVASFVLSPGFTRDSGEPTTLVIPKGTKLIRLHLHLEAGDNYAAYRGELRTTGARIVWSGDLVSVKSRDVVKSLILSLPVTSLPSGEYELTLKVPTANQAFEHIGYYYFSIRKR